MVDNTVGKASAIPKGCYSIGEFSLITNTPMVTLKLWDNQGKLVAHRTEKKVRYYDNEHFLNVINNITKYGVKYNVEQAKN